MGFCQVGTMGQTMACGLFSRFYLCLLALCTISFLMHSVQAKNCPNGWLIFDDLCYGIFKTKLSWTEAEMACQSFHQESHLVSILSEPEGRVLGHFLLDKSNQLGNVWIGLTDPNGDSMILSFQALGKISWPQWNPFWEMHVR
ncbi:lithostathine-like isoform X2 [Anolis carolinensis]|uniref:lithostathine-like isoform X2 n=1 Tax=Anolis carolinensis TaxID=28377 RepID=UPI002F2B17FE